MTRPESNPSPKPLFDKVILITGATGGLGAALSKYLAGQGAHIVAMARSIQKLEALDEAIAEVGGTATLIPFDLRQGAKISAIPSMVFEKCGRLDGLVLNAATLGTLGPLADIAIMQGLGSVLQINALSQQMLFAASLPYFQKAYQDAGKDPSRAATVIGIGCGLGFEANGTNGETIKPFWGAYATSKRLLMDFLAVQALEWKPDSGVKIHTLTPEPMNTELLKTAYPGGYHGGTVHAPGNPEFLHKLSELFL